MKNLQPQHSAGTPGSIPPGKVVPPALSLGGALESVQRNGAPPEPLQGSSENQAPRKSMGMGMWILIGAIAVLSVAMLAVAGMIALGGPSQPQPLAAVGAPMKMVDYSDLPAVQTMTARDGTSLAYRTYPGSTSNVAILIHGSSGPGSSLHALAKALAAAGITSIVPDIRGHGQSGRSGDIGYVGQLDDDLADLAAVVRARYPYARLSLAGHSAGGGFVLRIAGGKYADLFSRYVLIAPVLYYRAPTTRPNAGGWATVGIARQIGLTIADRLGITALDGLTIVRFAGSPEIARRIGQTLAYSRRLAANFGGPRDYLDILRRARQPITVLVGAEDTLLFADRYAPLIKTVRDDIPVEVVPGLGHMEMTIDPRATAKIAQALNAK